MVDQVVTDPKLIEELNASQKNQLTMDSKGVSREPVTDPDLIKELNLEANKKTVTEKGEGLLSSIGDFFTGSKSTEFKDLEEIGSANLGKFGVSSEPEIGANAKIALGLLLTPDQKAQAEIIQAQVPGTTVTADRFKNTIITFPDGKSFYLNKPGASMQDVLQTTSQILQYIPGFSFIAKRYAGNYLKRVAGQGLAGGATSIAQDVAAKQLGAKEISGTKALVSAAVPVVFEAVSPLVRYAIPKLFANPKFTTTNEEGKLILNAKGKKAAQAAGIDLNTVDDAFIQNFAEELQRGVQPKIASSQAGAGKFDFDLFKAQAAGDEAGISFFYKAASGAYGRPSQVLANDFLEKQGVDIGTSATNLLNKVYSGQITGGTLDEAGEAIKNSILKNYKTASDRVTTAYNMVDKDAVFNAGASNIDNLTFSVNKAIQDGTATVDPILTPATINGIKVIKDFVKKYQPTPAGAQGELIQMARQEVKPSTLNEFELIRKKIDGLYSAAANKTDKKNILTIKKEWDKFYDDAVDNMLFSGDQKAVQAIKAARAEYRTQQNLFGYNPIKKNGIKIEDPAGRAVIKILNDPDATPMKTINYVFGLGNLGNKQESVQIVKRLKNIFGVSGDDFATAVKNPDFQQLRQGAFNRVLEQSVKNGKFNKEAFVKNWDNASVKNKDLLRELFSKEEISLIGDFVKEVRKTFKPNTNIVESVSGLQFALSTFGRQLASLVGFKFGSIQGMLAAKTAVDNLRDITSKNMARKLIETEIMRDPQVKQSLVRPLATTQGAVNTALFGNIQPRTSPTPRGYTPTSDGQQPKRSSLPTPTEPNVNLFASKPTTQSPEPPAVDSGIKYQGLFPFDTTGQAIARGQQ